MFNCNYKCNWCVNYKCDCVCDDFLLVVFLTQAVNMTELQVKNTIAQFVETNVGIPADV